ncbi:hypothetical protein I79_002470 [Cricetulus griseus]|uniref:Uncharacterized protein n=1 Tax=Cricetulus griseus TaxID=10029 RepID=G3GXI0_CRIGR|nr:hypothetical protein I79_002470 [Cricetulus griseus]
MKSGRNTRVFNREKPYLQSDLASWRGSSLYSKPKNEIESAQPPDHLSLYVTLTTTLQAWSDTPVASP